MRERTLVAAFLLQVLSAHSACAVKRLASPSESTEEEVARVDAPPATTGQTSQEPPQTPTLPPPGEEVIADGAGAETRPFYLRSSASFYHYVRESSTTFASIRERITEGYYRDRGVSILTIYCPYRASDPFRGVPAQDFFATNPSTGSLEEFKAMVEVAHANGMSVIIYMGLLFVDTANAVWIKAQRDHGDGINSDEEGMFRWADAPGGETTACGGWQFSDDARAYFATSWGYPALDAAKAPARSYIRSVIEFWLDQNVDGIEYDDPTCLTGADAGVLKALYVDVPKAYSKKPQYLIAEGPSATAENEPWNDEVGFTHVLLSGDDDERSVATDVFNGDASIDELETHFARYIDTRRAAGKGVRSVSSYADLSSEERALEAAALAGNGSYMEIDYDEVYAHLSVAEQGAYDAVFRALARSSAEAPGSDRRRLSTRGGTHAYAVLRTDSSGMERAVNIYNFARAAATITVTLANSGISEGEAGFDLMTETRGAAAEAGQLVVSLPALGFTFLRFGPVPRP
jgi:Alpha amylase, catalytic domain